jgi:glycine cleavage system H protein
MAGWKPAPLEESIMTPQNLLYAETHEWVNVAHEGAKKIATIGISAFAVQQLTDLVFMQLPSVGTEVKAGKEFGEVESVKAVSPLYSPVSGQIVAVNDKLPTQLETLSSDPYGQGWMIKVALSDETELKLLLNQAAYDKQCAAEG